MKKPGNIQVTKAPNNISFLQLCLTLLFVVSLLVSNVINDIYSDPMKGVIYCVGFAAGVYVGTLIDEWLAVGLTSMQVVLDDQRAEQLGCALREQGYGVTILEGHSVGAAKRSMLGVFTFGSPAYPNACARHWSANTNTMLGFFMTAGSLSPRRPRA